MVRSDRVTPMSDRADGVIPGAAVGGGLLVIALAIGAVFLQPAPIPPPTVPPGATRLVVLVVFDQLRADLIDREERRAEFGPDGFRRLQDEGAWFTDCHYPYAATATGPGHAAMLTGAPPAVTGIVNNEWYDRQAAAEVYCAASKRYEVVPKPVKEPKFGGGNPDKLLVPTVADVLKEATGGRGKVFGVSLKDRSAVLPSGKRPDGVFWFDGRFVTSTYYTRDDRPLNPDWVTAFNASGKAESYFGTDWTRRLSEEKANALAGPDKGDGEGTGAGQGVTFPHPMTGGKDKEGKPFADVRSAGAKYYEALANSPFGNDLLLAFAKRCIDAEGLGADDVPDLLTVSFSSNDLIGHCWGPDSHEVLDCTLRSDAVLAELLTHLDEKVGQGKYAVILTADHGVCPLPEYVAAHPDRYPDAKGAKRVPGAKLLVAAEAHLREKFGKAGDDEPVPSDTPLGEEAKPSEGKKRTGWIEALSAPYLYLNRKVVADRGQSPDKVADELARWLRTQDGVQEAFTRERLNDPSADTEPLARWVRQSYHPDRSGDVYVVLKPYHLIEAPVLPGKIATGTTHGTPYAYDTHVPLLVYGPGVTGGKRADPVTPLHAAAVAAHFLRVPRPVKAQYELPASLLK